MAGRDIVGLGASVGGIETLERLVRELDHDPPAALFVVPHTAAE